MRNRPNLFALLVKQLPHAFIRTIEQRFPNLYEASHDTVLHDAMVSEPYRASLTGQVRHAYLQSEFGRCAQDNGLVVSLEYGESGYPYSIVNTGRLLLTSAVTSSISDVPKPAEFRAQLALMNQFDEAPKLPLSGDGMSAPAPRVRGRTVYAIVYHVALRPNVPAEYRRRPGFIGVGIPTPKMDGWAFSCSLLKIIEQQLARERAKEQAVEDRVRPTPRKKRIDQDGQ